MNTPVEQIKERLNISDVIGSYIKIEKSGVNFKAKCPFHNEKTPSFFISPNRGTYHCFGCNRGGDIFSFVQEIEGMDFPGALKILAQKAGVDIKNVDPKLKTEQADSYALLEEAKKFYKYVLYKNADAIKYLRDRGLADETIKEWEIGLAPSEGWDTLTKYLRSKGFTEKNLENSGLVIMGNRGLYDRFRERIMFPVNNSSGKTIAFSGRFIGDQEKVKNGDVAKYINSSDTPLYSKSKVLYGYDKAKLSMLRENSCVLVEGQMDILMSHQAGITNTVALSGTALTHDHLEMIKRFSDRLIIALDSDKAGITASLRAFDLANSLGLDVRVVQVPDGKDPADYVLKDPEGWKKAVLHAKHIIDFYLDILKGQGLDERAFRLEVGKTLLPYVRIITSKIDQSYFVSKLANELSMSEEHIWEELKKLQPRGDAPNAKGAEVAPVKSDHNRSKMIVDKIVGIILWQEGLMEPQIDLKKGKDRYEELVEQYGLEKIGNISAQKKGELIFQSEVYYANSNSLHDELIELSDNLEIDILEKEFAVEMAKVKEREKSGDHEGAIRSLKKCQDISGKINTIKHIRSVRKV